MFGILVIAILLFSFLILGIPVMLYLLFLRKKDEIKAGKIGQKIVSSMFNIMLKATFCDIKVSGIENIPKDINVLFVSNHRSCFDILLAYVYTPKVMGFVAKKEMSKYPLLKQWMDIVNCLFLDRKDMKAGLKTIIEAIEKEKKGISMWICPEGTRSKCESELDLLEFKEGSFKIAKKSKVMVVPVAISKTADIFEKHLPWIKKANVNMVYMKPFFVEDIENMENAKSVGVYTRDIILEELKKYN